MKEKLIVNFHNFTGPLDLLLNLIQKKNLDIKTLDILDLTNQYLFFFENQQKINIDLSSEYLYFASYLAEIKSRILIPKEIIEIDQSVELELENTKLRNQILEYKKYKEVSQTLGTYKNNADRLISKLYSDIELKNQKKPKIDLTKKININLLSSVFSNILKNFNNNSLQSIEMNNKILVPQQFEKIIIDNLINNNSEILFLELIQKINLKLNTQIIIVIFLSILNLAKNNQIIVSQINNDILIKKTRLES